MIPRLLAVAAAVVALASVTAVTLRPEGVDAAFTDTKYGAGDFAAATLPRPNVTACTYTSSAVTISWQFDSNPAGVSANQVAFTVSSDLLGSVTQTLLGSQLTTTPVSANHFTTRITTNVLSGVVGAILSSFTVTAQTALGNWTSAVSQPANATHLLLSPYTCTVG